MPSQPVFTCSKSIIKTERHCAQYVQSKTKNKFCKTKCVKPSFYKYTHFLLLCFLSTLWTYHFHCFSMSFLLLYLSFHLDSLHRHPDPWDFSHFHPDSRPRFYKNSYFISKTNIPLCYYFITLSTKSLFTSSGTLSVISPKSLTLKCLKSIISEVWANNYEWMKCYLRFMSKEGTTCRELSIFS